MQADVTNGDIFCYKPAPDRRHVLAQLRNGDLLIDLLSGQVQSTDIATRAAAWGPTGQDLLEHTPDAAADARLTNATQASLTQPLTFFPPDLGPAVTVLDTSPDGRYVVVCDGRWSETEGVVNRFLLYDSRQNLWFVIERGLYCPSIIGWLSHTDTLTR